jgi:DNA-binding response OmpR family regulator
MSSHVHSTAAEAVRSSQAALQGARVLCIDDDPQVCRAIELVLAAHGAKVICAYYGTQGLWLAMTERPDAVITDIGMPSGGGDYVVECLQRNAKTKGIPLVVLSGRSDPRLVRRLMNLGVERWLTKPVRSDDLVAALRPLVRHGADAGPSGGVNEETIDSGVAG